MKSESEPAIILRTEERVLKQRRPFFTDAYRRSKTHLLFEDDDLVGFASVRRDGYILFLLFRLRIVVRDMENG